VPRGQNRVEQNVCAEGVRLVALNASISARFAGEHPASASIVAAEAVARGQNRVEQNVCAEGVRLFAPTRRFSGASPV
jgi:hypothetical protein